MTTTDAQPTAPDTNQPQPWYRKKRHIAWMSLIGFIVLVSVFGDDTPPAPTPAEPAAAEEPAAPEIDPDPLGDVVLPEPEPEPAPEPEPEPEPEPVEPVFNKDDYEDVTAREFSKIARDPDSHFGRQVLVFGEVRQFDSFTGTDAFRADVDGDRQTGDYVFYDHNAFLSGDEEMLEDVVTDDRFRAYATVMGAMEYETTMGGTQNALRLSIDRIKVVD
jgi:hypothetical protein